MEIDSVIDSLDGYLDYLNSGISFEKQKHREFLDDSIKKSGEEEAELLLKFFGEDTKNFDYEFPRRAFSSFITGLYSTYEETLLSICKYFDLTLVVGPFDQFDNLKGIKKGRAILQQALKYEIFNDDWNEINLIRQLRNRVVHNAGEFRAVFENEVIEKNKAHFSNSQYKKRVYENGMGMLKSGWNLKLKWRDRDET